ncbi:MAG: glycosyltransferase [Candidatus Magasanikbacteria bacterium]
MKILIISASIGQGHVRAGEALKKKLKQEDIETEHIDLLNYLSNFWKRILSSSYKNITTKTPYLWGLLYNTSDNKCIRIFLNWFIENVISTEKLLDKVTTYNPDKIVCTHFLAPDLLSSLNISIKITTLITDYGIHSMWLSDNTDLYRVSTDLMKKNLRKRGVKKEQIKVKTLPIDPDFESLDTRPKLKKKMGFQQQFTILVMSGGDGLIKLKEIIEKLFQIQESINIISVAGKNKKLKKQIKQLESPQNIYYKALGWTDEIEKYIQISNIVISKPGGMTTTECIQTNTTLIATNPIPGQEEGNAEYLIKNNYGHLAESTDEILQLTREELKNSTEN